MGLVTHHGAALHDVDLLVIDLAQRVRRVKLFQKFNPLKVRCAFWVSGDRLHQGQDVLHFLIGRALVVGFLDDHPQHLAI